MTYPFGKGLLHAHPFAQFALSTGLRSWNTGHFCRFSPNIDLLEQPYDVLLAVFYEIKVRRLKLTQIARNVRYFSCSTDPGCCF